MKKVRNSVRLPSPALLFFEDAIRANIDMAIKIAGSSGRLRPHVKTHKTAELAAMAMARGILKFKCATIAEAEMLARAQAPDILLSYTLVGRNAERLIELVLKYPHAKFSTLTDNLEVAHVLNTLAEKAKVKLAFFSI